jgi:hypothetical protein
MNINQNASFGTFHLKFGGLLSKDFSFLKRIDRKVFNSTATYTYEKGSIE